MRRMGTAWLIALVISMGLVVPLAAADYQGASVLLKQAEFIRVDATEEILDSGDVRASVVFHAPHGVIVIQAEVYQNQAAFLQRSDAVLALKANPTATVTAITDGFLSTSFDERRDAWVSATVVTNADGGFDGDRSHAYVAWSHVLAQMVAIHPWKNLQQVHTTPLAWQAWVPAWLRLVYPDHEILQFVATDSTLSIWMGE